jgi:uncharacterized membrane protein
MDLVGIGLLILSVILVIGGAGVAIAAARPLGRELEEWREAGLITAAQAADLGARHAAAVALARLEGAAKALGVIGAAAVGAGVILFFAANWSEIPRPLRVAILLTGEAALYGAGFWLLEIRRRYRNVGHAFVFMGTILFGASIFLVGQMYNVQAHDPAGFLIWSGGALATTLFFRSKPAAGVFVLALEAWIIHELIENAGIGDPVYLPLALALYGLALYGLGTALRPWLDRAGLAGAMRVVGFAVAAIMIFALSFRYPYSGQSDRIDGLPLVVIIVSAVLALASGALLVVRRGELASVLEGATILAAGTLILVAVFARDGDGVQAEETFGRGGATFALLFAALLVLVAVGGIVVGALRDSAWLVNGAVALGALAIIGHFLDTAWARLPRSAVFVCVGGLVLAASAALERASRRRGPT